MPGQNSQVSPCCAIVKVGGPRNSGQGANDSGHPPKVWQARCHGYKIRGKAAN